MVEEGEDQIILPLLPSSPLNSHERPAIRYASIQMPTMNSNDELLLRGEPHGNRRWSLTSMVFSAASLVALTTFLILAILLFVLEPDIFASGTFKFFT